MSDVAVRRDGGDIIEAVVTKGDLARLTPEERTRYYVDVCKSVGLNPFTRPFEYISLNNKLVLYAKREATDQLRKLNGISLEIVSRETDGDLFVVHVRARDKSGRTDEDFGAVNIAGLRGEARANGALKAITKAKRRVTLSISGLGYLDETEIEDIPAPERKPADTRAQLDYFAGNAAAPEDTYTVDASAFDPDTGEVHLHGTELEAHARLEAAKGTQALRSLFRDLTQRQRNEIGALIGNQEQPGELLRLAQIADDRATEPPVGIPPAQAPRTAAETAPAGDPDPVWLAEFSALEPRPTDDGDGALDWSLYVEASQYLLSRASKADLAALELSRNAHMKRLREEAPELYRRVTQAVAERARELAGAGA
jgi:hypothetical protein